MIYNSSTIHYERWPKGLLAGKYIGENIRHTLDLIHECEKNNIHSLIMLIDYEKAFDSLCWECIEQTLKIFNLYSHIIQWVKILQKGSYSIISQNGHSSGSKPLFRGWRQGDLVSPYIFVVCAEVLAEAFCNNDGPDIHFFVDKIWSK